MERGILSRRKNKELCICSVMHSSRAKATVQSGSGIWTYYASDVNIGNWREINPARQKAAVAEAELPCKGS